MARSFIGGAVVGGIFAVVGASGLSLIAPPPEVLFSDDGAMHETMSDKDMQGMSDAMADPATPAQMSEPSVPPATDMPEPDTLDRMAGMEPAEKPETPVSEDMLSDPPEEGDLGMPKQDSVPDALPNSALSQTALPSAPETDSGMSMDDQPVQPSLEQTETEGNALPEPKTDEPDVMVSSPRLPKIGGDEPAEQADMAKTPVPPVVKFAAPFANPEDKPLMSIILIDRGEFPGAVDALSAFPYPVSFAIDPTVEGAEKTMQQYRDAGFEVLTLINLPEGATAKDVETSLEALLPKVPEAVAILEGDKTGLQSNREVSDQVAAYLAQSGHGLVMMPKGLDTARKLAQKEGVPAATIFRDLDSQGQDSRVIRRFLDQAAFKARQSDEGVIMLARARPETVSALVLWGLADRASSVALAPITTVLSPSAQ